jgi:hypothetical protein
MIKRFTNQITSSITNSLGPLAIFSDTDALLHVSSSVSLASNNLNRKLWE